MIYYTFFTGFIALILLHNFQYNFVSIFGGYIIVNFFICMENELEEKKKERDIEYRVRFEKDSKIPGLGTFG